MTFFFAISRPPGARLNSTSKKSFSRLFPVHLVHGLSAPALSPPKENFSLMKLRQLDQARAFCLIAFNPLEARNKTKE